MEEKFATTVVRKDEERKPVNPVVVPIYASSTYQLDNTQHGANLSNLNFVESESRWLYSRWGNPTGDTAARKICLLEKGKVGFVTASGMAAITTAVFAFLKAGDHAIFPNPVYGGTNELGKKLRDFGVETSFVDGTNIASFQAAIKENTKLIYTETPANPTMSLTDLKSIAELAKSHGIISMVDSTFASPYNQRPLELGIDVVIHSATKYLGGHSDIIAGAIIVGKDELVKPIFQTLKLFGGILSPFDAYLLLRGIKTLDVRMRQHNENALAIATFLEQHPKVERVYYPGLPSHPQHELAKQQMKGFGGMIAFEVKGGADAGRKVIESFKHILLAVSLGGVESLVEQASTMTHTMVPREERLAAGITDGLIRFSVGIEDKEDLISDLEQALALI